MTFLALAAWVGCLWLTIACQRIVRRHQVSAPESGQGTTSISIVVAAHDEAPRIGRFLRSLRLQDHPAMEVIVVDDRSHDGTADAARAEVDGDERFQILTVSERPPGWQGRMHAQGAGAARAKGEWLMFLSADQELADPLFLRAMVEQYERGDYAAVSVVGPFGGKGWWQRWWFHPIFNNPILWGVIFLVQSMAPDARWLIGALGLRRSVFEDVGGVRAAAVCAAGGFDDWGWAEVFQRRNARTRMAYHPALLDHSNWSSFTSFWNGLVRWQVGIFTYRKGGWIAAGAIAGFVLFLLAGPATLIADLLSSQPPRQWAMVLSAVGPTIGLGYSRWASERAWFALYFPVVGILLLVSLLGAVSARLRNRVNWRDETLHVVAPPPRSD